MSSGASLKWRSRGRFRRFAGWTIPIHEHRVDMMDAQVMEYTIEFVKAACTGVAGVEAFLAHPLGRHAQRFTVSVDTDQRARGAARYCTHDRPNRACSRRQCFRAVEGGGDETTHSSTVPAGGWLKIRHGTPPFIVGRTSLAISE